MRDTNILNQPFDLQTHADNFINYLEIVIREDGVVEYATPSHTKKLEQIAIKIYGVEKFKEMLNSQQDAFIDYIQWLCNITKCVSVWNDFCILPHKATKEQMHTLEVLSNTPYTHAPICKLYKGRLHNA